VAVALDHPIGKGLSIEVYGGQPANRRSGHRRSYTACRRSPTRSHRCRTTGSTRRTSRTGSSPGRCIRRSGKSKGPRSTDVNQMTTGSGSSWQPWTPGRPGCRSRRRRAGCCRSRADR
jgi:hypothetical protein